MADRAARQLNRAAVGKMYCLGGLGGDIQSFIDTTRMASTILAIDGCPSACASAILKRTGFSGFAQLQLANIGINKGTSPATPETIERIVASARELI